MANQTPGVIRYYHNYHSLPRIQEIIVQAKVLLLINDHDIIATSCLDQEYIKAVMVKPEFQGKGLGSWIMKILEEEARSARVTCLHLDAVPGTVNFYSRLGYIGDKEHWMPVKGGERLFYTPMVKKLS